MYDVHTICQSCLDQFYIVCYYINWVKTSHSTYKKEVISEGVPRCLKVSDESAKKVGFTHQRTYQLQKEESYFLSVLGLSGRYPAFYSGLDRIFDLLFRVIQDIRPFIQS